jgi:hypothetical protein
VTKNVLSEAVVEDEYRRLDHTLGWRFLTCPYKNVEDATTALITLNPGGAKFYDPIWSVESGSAYEVECWPGFAAGQAPLQKQVRRMFELARVLPKDVLSGYLVPFRSRSWKELPRQDKSLDFGRHLWTHVFAQTKATTIFAFGKSVAPSLVGILQAVHPPTKCRAGWGKQTIDVYRLEGAKRLIVLPHLSRFPLFNRPHSESESAFLKALAESQMV